MHIVEMLHQHNLCVFASMQIVEMLHQHSCVLKQALELKMPFIW